MLKLSSSRGIRIDAPLLSVSWSFEDHSVIIKALRKGLIEHEASDTGGVPRWQSSCPDRLAEATDPTFPAEKEKKMQNARQGHIKKACANIQGPISQKRRRYLDCCAVKCKSHGWLCIVPGNYLVVVYINLGR